MTGQNAMTIRNERRSGISRRTFIRSLAIGAAGVALTLPRASSIFGADTLIASTEPLAGQITLDGLMLTYFASGTANTTSTFTLGKNFSSTFTLKLPQSPGIELIGTAPPADAPVPGAYRQHASGKVKNALILRSNFGRSAEDPDGDASATDPAGGTIEDTFSSQSATGNLQFYGLKKPTLAFHGGPDKLHFHFDEIGKPSFDLGADLESDSAQSMSNLLSSDVASLVPPRFYWADVNGIEGGTTFDLGLPSAFLASTVATATVTAKIAKRMGFTSPVLKQAFAPGNDIEITYYSVQEFPSDSLMELVSTPWQTGSSRIYIDKIFKTFTVMDKPSS